MGLVFIDGKNNDYPCFLELRDLWNANISSPPYSTGLLVVGGDYPHYSYLKKLPEKVESTPYPATIFRCLGEMYNNGYPIKLHLPGIKIVQFIVEKSTQYVHVYGSRNNDYDSNGYAIIQPISCTINQEKNGMYEVELETNIDDDGKYKYIECNKILKVPIKYHGEFKYQLFRIYNTKRKMDSNGVYRIIANARHIFYDLNDKILIDCRPTMLGSSAALDWIMNGMYGFNNDSFTYYTDIVRNSTAYYQNVSVTAALLGEDNAFTNRWGGCLYRDNFYFSFCNDTEYSKNTGTIRYGYNMIDIEFETDYSECLTTLIATDNFGNRTRIVNNAVPSDKFPHHIYKAVSISYDVENKAQFLADAQAYFDNYKQESVNIKVTFADLSDIDLYADFLQLADYEVGDKVTVYHKDLNINYGNLEIISKKYDAVNRQTTEIEIGSFKNAIVRTGFMASTVSTTTSVEQKQLIATQKQLDDVAFATFVTTPILTVDGEYLITSDNKYLLYKE